MFSNVCQTPCEQCFTPFNNSGNASTLCGLFNTEDSYDAKYSAGNFTFEAIINATLEDFVTGIASSDYCIQYTRDQFSNSEVCVIYMNELSEPDTFYCNVTYNDVLCNSCTVTPDEDECLIADCTNVDATYGAMLDSCQNLAADGPFQAVYLLDAFDDTTFTVGSCDVDVPARAPSAAGNAPAVSPSKNAPTSNGNGSASIFPLSYIAFVITSIAMLRALGTNVRKRG